MIALAFALLCVTQSAAGHQPTRLVSESAKASFKGGVLEVRGGSGWLRTSRPLLDFDLQFEFRAMTPDADPGLMVRTWVGDRLWPFKGYRLRLPTRADLDAASLFVGRRQNVQVLQPGRVDLRDAAEWQTVKVTAEGERIRVAVNGTLAGEFAVEEFGGFVMFDNRKGRVELRNVEIAELNVPFASDVIQLEELKNAGGQGPEVVREVQPVYSFEAKTEQVRGVVALEAVILSDGSVGPVRITRSLHRDLDPAAVAAIKRWKFRPATLNGKPVPVLVNVEMTFTLR